MLQAMLRSSWGLSSPPKRQYHTLQIASLSLGGRREQCSSLVTSFIFLMVPSNAWIINTALLFQFYQTGEFKYYDYSSDNMLHYNQVREIHSHLSVLKEEKKKKKKENGNENIAVAETEFYGIYGIYLIGLYLPYKKKRSVVSFSDDFLTL